MKEVRGKEGRGDETGGQVYEERRRKLLSWRGSCEDTDAS